MIFPPDRFFKGVTKFSPSTLVLSQKNVSVFAGSDVLRYLKSSGEKQRRFFSPASRLHWHSHAQEPHRHSNLDMKNPSRECNKSYSMVRSGNTFRKIVSFKVRELSRNFYLGQGKPAFFSLTW